MAAPDPLPRAGTDEPVGADARTAAPDAHRETGLRELRDDDRRTLFALSPKGAVTLVSMVALYILARQIFVAAHQPLSWAAAAVVAAVLIDPVVDRLAAKIRRVPAVLVTFLAIAAIALSTTYAVADNLQSAIKRMETAAPEAAVRVEGRDDRLGELAVDFKLTERVTSFVEALGDRVTGGDDVLRESAGTAPTYLVSAILTIFLMTYGPRIATSALQQHPDPQRRDQAAEVVGLAVVRARGAVLGTLGIALGVALLSTATSELLGLPAPLAVGFFAGLLALLPYVGILVGSVPLLLLLVGFRSGTAAVVLAIVVLVVQVVDAAWLRPTLARRTVDVGMAVPWVVALLGYSIYGVGGGAYGLAYAIFGLAVLDQLHRQRRSAASAAADTAGTEDTAGTVGRTHTANTAAAGEAAGATDTPTATPAPSS